MANIINWDENPLVQELEKERAVSMRLINERDEARAEVERLKTELAQAISERTPHDYGILKDQRDSYRDRLCASIKETQEARAEVEERKEALIDASRRMDELKEQRDHWHKKAKEENEKFLNASIELDRLKAELSDSTNHYNGVINDLVKSRDEARGDAAHLKRIAKHRQEEISALLARPEPSRLEIAAMFLANVPGSCVMTIEGALNAADNLIAAAKEAQ